MLELRNARARWGMQLVLTAMIIPFAAPLYLMVQGSTQGDGLLRNYRAVLSRPELPRFFLNSIEIAVLVIVITYTCTMLAAYALAKLRLRGREIAFYVLLAGLTLPSASLSVPLFITIRELGLFNTDWAVVLPLSALQISFSVLLARSFMEGVPDAILDAARCDGASSRQAFWHVLLPICRPVSAVIIVWSFVGAWNEYLLPLLFLQKTDQQTITLVPTFFESQYTADQTKIMAASVITTIPTVLLYLGLQRFFERGLTVGAVK